MVTKIKKVKHNDFLKALKHYQKSIFKVNDYFMEIIIPYIFGEK